MLPKDENIAYLVGTPDRPLDIRGLRPYQAVICDFLSELSGRLLSDPSAKRHSDIISFAFWCRKANLAKLRKEFDERHLRLGLGLVLHIAPSNVPVNFAFSFAISLLAGNANIVRVPSKPFPQVEIICEAVRKILREDKFKRVADMTVFVRYDKNDHVTADLSAHCNARLLWGGDETIRRLREIPVPVRAVDLAFADRYSLSIIGARAVLELGTAEMRKVAADFYNDTYAMDQNACSSPSLVVWLGGTEAVSKAKTLFWQAVYETAKDKYELAAVSALDKYTRLCRDAIDLEELAAYEQRGNYVYTLELSDLPGNLENMSAKCGYFYEYSTEELLDVARIINGKYQTLTYFGLDKNRLADFVISNRLSGIDRLVPVGQALDMSVIWDGYDLVRSLSRIVEVR